MRISIPWWSKIAAKLILSRLPVGYAAWRSLGIFLHGAMDSAGYAREVFDGHVRRSGTATRLRGATILELGPGDSIATAILAAAHGARAILVDRARYARSDLAACRELERNLSADGIPAPDLGSCRTVEDVLRRCGARYLTRGIRSLHEIDGGSVDLVFSQAVLEHVRLREFMPTLKQLRRILKPDGVASHVIDLRDHLGAALNNLRFGDRLWESEFFASSGFYTNRIRFGEMIGLFREAGFAVEIQGTRRWTTLPTPRRRMSARFREVPEDDLLVGDFDAVLRTALSGA